MSIAFIPHTVTIKPKVITKVNTKITKKKTSVLKSLDTFRFKDTQAASEPVVRKPNIKAGIFPQAKLYIDSLKDMCACNALAGVEFELSVENSDLDIDAIAMVDSTLGESINMAKNPVVLTLYITATSYNYAAIKSLLQAQTNQYGIQLGVMSNDGYCAGQLLVSMRYLIKNVEYKDAKNYFNGNKVDDSKLGTLVDCRPVVEANVTYTPKSKTKLPNTNKSAFACIKECLDSILGKLSPAHIEKLSSADFMKSNAGLSYALLLHVDSTVPYEVQTTFHGKSRYSKKTVNINGENYYVCNHVFHRNVERINNCMQSLVM